MYTRLILDLMGSLVNRWSPLTHTSQCTTASRPEAATQMRVMHPNVSLLLHFRANGLAENMLVRIP